MSIQDEKDLQNLYPDGITIKIAGEEFVIKPFVLRNRIKVIQIIAEVFAQMAVNNPSIGSAGNNAVLVIFINTAGEKLIDLYKLLTGKEADWLLDNVKLKDEINIISAVMEVNDFPFLLSQAKNMMKKA